MDNPEHTWTLLIKFIRKEDEGIYDCQVSRSNLTCWSLYRGVPDPFNFVLQITTRRGAWTQSVELRIVEPQAVLVGSEDIYVGVGSPFTITCVITNVSLLYHLHRLSLSLIHQSRLTMMAEPFWKKKKILSATSW